MEEILFENFFNGQNLKDNNGVLIDESLIKVKFNMNASNSSERAWDFLKADDNSADFDRWIEMNEHKKIQSNNNYANAKYVITLAQYYPYGPEYFIFGGVYKIDIRRPEVVEGRGYKITLQNCFKEYRKRLIIKLRKPIGRDSYNRLYENLQNALNPIIYEILPAPVDNFPGYNNIHITHKKLQHIFNNEMPEWKNNLSLVKGIYCVTDTSNGKLYIGSATGVGGIWQRWSQYANISNLTGHNKNFEDLKEFKGGNYLISNFSYSIIEIFDQKTPNAIVLQRESFWKNVFETRKYGMNEN